MTLNTTTISTIMTTAANQFVLPYWLSILKDIFWWIVFFCMEGFMAIYFVSLIGLLLSCAVAILKQKCCNKKQNEESEKERSRESLRLAQKGINLEEGLVFRAQKLRILRNESIGTFGTNTDDTSDIEENKEEVSQITYLSYDSDKKLFIV